MSALGERPTVHETCRVRDSVLGAWTDLGPRTTIVESTFGDYSYTAGDVSLFDRRPHEGGGCWWRW